MTPREQALVEAARELAEAQDDIDNRPSIGVSVRTEARQMVRRQAAFRALSAALSQYEDKETDNG